MISLLRLTGKPSLQGLAVRSAGLSRRKSTILPERVNLVVDSVSAWTVPTRSIARSSRFTMTSVSVLCAVHPFGNILILKLYTIAASQKRTPVIEEYHMSQEDREKWNQRYATDDYKKTNPVGLLHEWAPRLKAGKALDIACGAGRNAIYLAELGFDVDAIDISSEGLNLGRRKQCTAAEH